MDSTTRRGARDLHYHVVCVDKLRFAVPERRKRHTYLNMGLTVKSQTLHSKPSFLLGDVPFGVWPGFFSYLECGFHFHFLECGKVFVVLVFFCSFFGDPSRGLMLCVLR